MSFAALQAYALSPSRFVQMENLMTASAEEEVLVTVGETLGSAAGKVVAAAKRTASTLTDEKRKIVRAASKARSGARRVINKTKRKTSKAAKSAKRQLALPSRPSSG